MRLMLLTDATPKVELVADAGCIPVRKQIQTTAHGVVIEQANIRACLKRRYLLFDTISTFSGCTYGSTFTSISLSRFQHGGAALPPPSLGGVLGGAPFPLSSVGWCCSAPTKKEKNGQKKQLTVFHKKKKNRKKSFKKDLCRTRQNLQPFVATNFDSEKRKKKKKT